MGSSLFKKDHPPMPGEDAVMYAIRTQAFLPSSLASGPFAGIPLREVPGWFLEDVLTSRVLPYEFSEAVGLELCRRKMETDTTPTVEEVFVFAGAEAQRMTVQLEQEIAKAKRAGILPRSYRHAR